ncbi:MAG: coproporphyrinogen III oxidase [Rhodobacteraceae bacterium]|nr:coproporphyrinogen III oxidase [Paracoccaceae bacterium]
MERWQQAGFALYVHWPFCQSKCPYCDFNSHVSSSVDQAVWQQSYLSELRRVALETEGRVLQSVFFGGGTPSLMMPSLVAAIVDEATRLWTPANDIEITLEANPTSVEANRFAGYRAAGVNRVSIGVQALNDRDLRRLGRMHDAAEARSAIALGQKIFDRTSFDLIYARQDQSLGDWQGELSAALDIAGDHLSLYQLTVEPETVFGARHARGQLRGLPDEGLSADMYLATQDLCNAVGLPAYEVSNHAREQSFSRHNMVYWRGGDYLGIGPGAHGRLTLRQGPRFATFCPASPGTWLDRVAKTKNGEDPRESLTAEDQGRELMVMGLRVSSGLDVEMYETITGKTIDARKITELSDLGLLQLCGTRLKTSVQGRLVLNSVIRHLAD